jgi:hypothetical protein
MCMISVPYRPHYISSSSALTADSPKRRQALTARTPVVSLLDLKRLLHNIERHDPSTSAHNSLHRLRSDLRLGLRFLLGLGLKLRLLFVCLQLFFILALERRLLCLCLLFWLEETFETRLL